MTLAQFDALLTRHQGRSRKQPQIRQLTQSEWIAAVTAPD